MKKFLIAVTLLVVGIIGGFALASQNFHSQAKQNQTNSSEMKFVEPKNAGEKGKYVFLNASENPDGNTAKMAKKMFKNHPYEQINLADYNIPQLGQGDGDFKQVYNKLKGAKVIVIGTPVYWSNMSGYLKTFIDHMEISDDLKGADLYAIVQGSDVKQPLARQSVYGTLNRIAYRFGLNFIGIASDNSEVKQLSSKMK